MERKTRTTPARRAFSLFEVMVCVVILGVVGIVCSTMLLHLGQNLAYTRALDDKGARLALLQLENLLQYAIAQSLESAPNTSLNAPSSELRFYSIDEEFLLGEQGAPTLLGDVRLPSYGLEVSAHKGSTLTLSQGFSTGWQLYLYTQPQESFAPYTITATHADTITLDRAPTQNPRLALKILPHHIELRDSKLWLDGEVIALGVSEFVITPRSVPQGQFLELQLCTQIGARQLCERGGAWITPIVEDL